MRAIYNTDSQMKDYVAHSGQEVTITETLGWALSTQHQGQMIFMIEANDGWSGAAYTSELTNPEPLKDKD